MPMSLASSAGWFQSIMIRVCQGLYRVHLFIDHVVCFSKTVIASMTAIFHKMSEQPISFNLNLASTKSH